MAWPGFGYRSNFSATFAIKDWFFDREKVARLIDQQSHKALFKFGGNVRQSARRSIKKKNKAREYRRFQKQRRLFEAGKLHGPLREDIRRSSPGDPPFSWEPEPNVRTILYAYEPANRTVVIGPVLLDGSKTTPPVPHTLEYGGTTEVQEYRFPGQGRWVRGRPPHRRSAAWANRRPAETRRRRANVAARPFMHPALRKVAPGFPELFGR